jgi:hypothetical protein
MGSKDAVKNPYIFDRPIEDNKMFFGREDVFEFVRHNLIGQYQDNVIVLYGEQRMGKTSVLKQMHHYLDYSHLCVYIDLERIEIVGIGNLLWQVADAIRRALQADKINLPLPPIEELTSNQDPSRYFVGIFLKQVQETLQGRRVLVMFDGAMRLSEALRAGKLEDDVFPRLSHLLRDQSVVNSIFCMSNSPRKIDREFAQAFQSPLYKEISFLEREETMDLITRPVKGLFNYSQPAIEEICRLTSGHPYFTQVICHSLFNRWQMQPRDILDEQDVMAVLDEAIKSTRGHLQSLWKDLAADEKTVSRTLAELVSDGREANGQTIDRTLAAYDIHLAPGQVTAALETSSACGSTIKRALNGSSKKLATEPALPKKRPSSIPKRYAAAICNTCRMGASG